jgi:hypothetical protein
LIRKQDGRASTPVKKSYLFLSPASADRFFAARRSFFAERGYPRRDRERPEKMRNAECGKTLNAERGTLNDVGLRATSNF